MFDRFAKPWESFVGAGTLDAGGRSRPQHQERTRSFVVIQATITLIIDELLPWQYDLHS
jgi:hypothetical protein